MNTSRLLCIILFVFSDITGNCQQGQWLNYTDDFYITAIAFEGDYVWVGCDGGLIRLERSTGSKVFYNSANSLTGNRVRSICIDDNNNKWIGVIGGLLKFDGNNWTDYHNLPGGIQLNNINVILKNKNGDLYFSGSTPVGSNILIKFDGNSFSNVALPVSDPYFFDIDTSNNLWFRTGTSILKYDGASWVTYDSLNTPMVPGWKVLGAEVDKNNNVWISTSNYAQTSSLLLRFDGINWSSYSSSTPGLTSAFIYQMYNDDNNHMWFYGTNYVSGVIEFDGNSFHNHTTGNYGLPFSSISAIAKDSTGHEWYGFWVDSQYIFYEYDGVSWIPYDLANSGLPNDYAEYISIDKNNNKWITCSSGGLSKFNGFTWTNYNVGNSGIISNLTTKTYFDPSGILWTFGDDNNVNTPPLGKFDGNNWTTFSLGNSSSNHIESEKAIMDTAGILWIATNVGLARLNGSSYTFYNAQNSPLPYDLVFDVTIDLNNELWIATYDGLASFNGTSWHVYTNGNSGLPDNHIYSVYVDHLNNKWFMTGTGSLTKFDGNTWIDYPASISGTQGFGGITCDNENNLYVGIEGGIAKFDGNTWTKYNMYNSGSSGSALSIAIDGANNKWICTYNGVSVFNETQIDFQSYYNIPKYKISGNVFYDTNSNGIKDVGSDHGISHQKIELFPDSIITYTNSQGNYAFAKNAGNYVTEFYANPNWNLTSAASSYSVLPDTVNISGLDFGTSPAVIFDSAEIFLSSCNPRCMSVAPYYIDCFNHGTSVLNGDIVFNIDDSMTFISALPVPDMVSGNILTWHIVSLLPYQSKQINVILQNPMMYFFDSTIVSSNVQFIINQIIADGDTVTELIRCSYDPNDKNVKPAGIGSNHQTLMNEFLEYTIIFQNTGNDTAFNIIILDTLNKAFDINTLELISSSWPVNMTVSSSGVIMFQFNTINLLWAKANETASHGYIKFRVKPKSGLPSNTLITNTSYIYFDFNQAIITNTTLNTLVYSTTSVIDNLYNSNLHIYPNPAAGYVNIVLEGMHYSDLIIKLIDMKGRVLQQKVMNGNKITLMTENISDGIYMLCFSNNLGVRNEKIIIQH